MVWVYEHTQSLLMVMLMHVPIVVGQFVLIPPTLSGAPLMAFDLAWAAVLWAVVAVVALAGGHLSRQALQRQAA
jgi:hypothetical protein